MKEVKEARIGDTFFKAGQKVDPQPGFEPSKPMLFAGVYPLDPDEYGHLEKKYLYFLSKSLKTSINRSCCYLYSLKQCHSRQRISLRIFRSLTHGRLQAKIV